MSKAIDITGQKFGKLTAIKLHHIKRYESCTKRYWLCKCECGNSAIVSQGQLTCGKTKSCGCMQSLYFETKHKMAHTRLYNTWENMRKRCYKKQDKHYKWYGARGIKTCEEWKNDFVPFMNWALNNGYNEKLTLDRIDVNKDYTPENCRWVNWITQQRNKRSNHLLTYKNKTLCISEWADIYNINRSTLSYRIKKGWSIEKALNTPTNSIKKS